MKKHDNEAVRAVRKIIGLTQAEFAVMIGASKDAVVSWETGRNKLSAAYARRIALVTGVDGRMLQSGVSVPFAAGEAREYTAEDFERHQRTEWGSTDEASARRQLEHCHDTMEMLLLAAAQAGGDKQRLRLPGLMDSFIQWCEGARADFQLEGELDRQLEARRFKAGMTQEMRDWRAMARGAAGAGALAAAGFRNDGSRGDREEQSLELELMPGWAPGRRMKPPKPAIVKVAALKADSKPM